ncbi:MAG: hypothetical protein K9M75_01475 [Phycisphaerae bacterium]|nr:hypothetical protein [Phycisphaerae bacterium]
MIKCNNPIPSTPEEWFKEITLAYADAKETIPVSKITGTDMTEDELYHLAPAVCLKFRDIKNTKKILKKATESALSSLIATSSVYEEVLLNPMLSFSFCYLSSHFGLDIIEEDLVNETMDYIESKI